MANALKQINARAKALKKKHPGKKYKTLQKQAGAEYKSGKLKAKRKKPAKKKAVKRKAAPRKKRPAKRRVGKSTTVVYSLGKLVKRKPRKATRKTKRKTGRRVSGSSSSLMPILLVGGLGVLAYMLLKPATPPALYQSSNATRNNAANNILAYATAGAMSISAITALINALNNMSDADVIRASNNPASSIPAIVGPTASVQAPTGGPGITMNM